MKRQGLISILACLLLSMGLPHTMYGMEALAEVASKEAMESAGKAMAEAGMKGSDTAMAKMTETLAKSMDKAALELTKGTEMESSAVMKSLESSATKELEVFGGDAVKAEADLAKNSENLSLKMTENVQNKSVQQLMDSGMTEAEATGLKQTEKEANEALEGTATKGATKGATKVEATPLEIKEPTNPYTAEELKSTDELTEAGVKKFNSLDEEGQENFLKSTKAQRKAFSEAADKEAAKTEESAFISKGVKKVLKGDVSLEDAKLAAKSVGGKVMGVVEIVGMAVLFMIPSIFESGFLAEEQKNALLMTYSTPIQFGNIVLQMPDSEINVSDPAQMTEFYYYGIPVDAVGNPLSKSATAQYPGVTGPDHNNPVSKSIKNGYAKWASMGTAKTTPPPARYNMNVDALSALPIFVSGVSESYEKWGSSAINSAYFEQKLVNLDTGYVFYADGLADNTPAAPLVGSAETKSVESYLSTKMGQLQTQGSASSYTEYTDTFSSSKASSTSDAITNRFNCGCLQKNQDLSAANIKTCKDSKTCLLVPALESLAAGLAIGADGKQLLTVDALTKDVAQGALGQVIPIQGYGTDYLKFFPNAKPQVISSSNLTTSYGFLDADGVATSPSDADTEVVGANPDNYAAKGIYVYQCKNTPFVKMLQHQLGTVNDHVYDFIVFFDHELNQVPLMVPMEDPKNYNFPTMQMNPAIEYFSTIIGSTDSQGSFAYLPQLMYDPGQGQKPVVPLYSLYLEANPKDPNAPKRLHVNGNAQLLAKLDDIVKKLEKNVDIGAQFSATRDALVSLALQGPFTKYSLSPVDATMTPDIGGRKMPVYKGFNAYPLPQTEDHAIYSDILIPLVGSSTAVLPSDKVTKYYGMVTDLTYAVDASGSISMDIPVIDKTSGKQTVDAAGNLQFTKGYAGSCIAPKVDSTGKIIGWTIDSTKASVYTWVNNLTKMNGGSPLAKPLTDYITAARAAWLDWIGNANLTPAQHAEINGITWQGSSASKVLTIIDKQALTSSLYVYTCSPVPSKLAQDFFVLTNSKSPAVTDPSLGTMSASVATATTNMLSLVSGILYDAKGTPVKNSLGVNYQVDPMTLNNSVWKSNEQGFSDNAMTIITDAFYSYKKAAAGFVYPFNFYTYKLGMYQADIDIACYVYADASGAGTSTNFKPQDYFVTYDDKAGVSANQQLSGDATQCIVSLVSGVVYNKNGAVHRLSDASLASLYTSVSKLLREDLKVDIDAAKKAFAKPSAPVATNDTGVAGITWKQADVAAKIAAIASQPYVPAPYVMLKYEPKSQQYVQVSPASTDGTDYMYTFFDVPYSDGAGNTIHVGGMFDSSGNQLYLFGDLQLESALIQNGICIISHNGPQQLGVPSLQPIMLLDKADYSLKPGATGASMIHADSQDFPTLSTITSPVTVGKSTFYFYYNTIMQAYYVMEVNGKDVRYISMAGGNIYNQDGSLRPSTNPAALRNGTDVTDIFLPYLNQNGYTQAVMMYSKNNLYQNFMNVESSFDGNVKLNSAPVASNTLSYMGNTVTVVQSPRVGTIPPMPDIHDATQYNVYWDTSNPSIYKVDASYSWQALSLLPIKMSNNDRSLMSSMPAQSMRNAGIVLKNGVVDRLVFANNLYAGPLSAMKQVGNPTAPTVKLTLKKDPKTCVKDLTTGKDDQSTGISYYEIVTSDGTYNYSVVFDQLSDDQLTSYQYNAWKSETVADVKGSIILAQFLPTSGSGSLQLDNIGIQSISNPPSDAAAQATLTKALTRMKKDAAHGRFIAQVFASDSSQITDPNNKDKQSTYLSQDGYVDLETGALFDTKGVPRGIALSMTDLNSLTTKLTVAVSRPSVVDKDGNVVFNKMGKPVMSKDATLRYKVPFVPRFARGSTSTTSTTASQAQASVLGRLSSAPDNATLPEVVKEVKEQAPLSPEDQTILNLKNRLESLGSTQEEEALKSEIQADLKKFELYRAKSEWNKLRALNEKFEQTEKKEAEKLEKSLMQAKEGVKNPEGTGKENIGDSQEDQPVVVPALTQAQQLQNQLAQLHSRKADVDLQKQVNKLKSSLPKTDEEQIERLENHNQQLQSAIDVLTKDIAKTSKGKQNDYVKGLLKNKRDTITKHQTLINNNSEKIDALRNQTVSNSSTSQAQAGVLGRLGSHETEKSSNGYFGWMSFLWNEIGSLLVGN